jgi:hypothetical protein
MVFKLNKAHIELISLNVKPNSQVDLSTPESIHEALVNSPEELTFFKSEKNYSKEREEEIHEMLEQGCVNSSKEFWDALSNTI